ncbi:unnamed protein product [Orchesella dallaii]|uniref:Uncharacterized protein n=1 Tax=Orchesella dallaii TaxID=48710 RepID=A0ABP1RDF2_9HEXA
MVVLKLLLNIFLSHFVATSALPIVFDLDCYVRIILERTANSSLFTPFQTSPLFPIQTTISSESTHSYMIHDLSNFNFAFDPEDVYINDQLTLSDGYFGFFSKHHQVCNIFVLFTVTFNGTVTAIQQSGYGTDENSMFLLVRECCDNFTDANIQMKSFTTEFATLETTSLLAFYSNLAFVFHPKLSNNFETTAIIRLYAYCYYCPNNNFPEISAEFQDLKRIPFQLSGIRSKCKSLNDNGWKRKIIIMTSAPPLSYDVLFRNINHKIKNGRKNFQQHLTESYLAEYILFRMASDITNMTIDPVIRAFHADDDPDTHWHLNIKVVDTLMPIFRNIISVTRGSYLLTMQDSLSFIYCMKTADLVKVKWDIYIWVLDPSTWICILMVLLGYAFIYKSIFKGLDLLWILFDLDFLRQHPRTIIYFYLLGAIFLPWIYGSGISTDFIDFDFPVDITELSSKGYTIWDVDLDVKALKQVQKLLPEPVFTFLEANTGFRDFEKAVYVDENFKMPGNFRDRLKEMASRKLVFLNGDENYYTFPSLFVTLWTMKKAVFERDFLCGIVQQAPRFNVQLTLSFHVRGYMSTKFTGLYNRYLEAGFVKYLQSLITLQAALKTRVSVDDVSAVLNSSTVSVRTPLGVICVAIRWNILNRKVQIQQPGPGLGLHYFFNVISILLGFTPCFYVVLDSFYHQNKYPVDQIYLYIITMVLASGASTTNYIVTRDCKQMCHSFNVLYNFEMETRKLERPYTGRPKKCVDWIGIFVCLNVLGFSTVPFLLPPTTVFFTLDPLYYILKEFLPSEERSICVIVFTFSVRYLILGQVGLMKGLEKPSKGFAFITLYQ